MTAVAEMTGAESVAWNLADLYVGADDPALARDLDACDARAEAFNGAYRGKVAMLDAATLLRAVEEYEAISELAVKLGSFAQLQWTTNTNEPKYGALLQKLTERGSKIEQKLIFFMLEWIEVPDDRATQLIADPTLAHYRHFLEAERRYRPHVLSEAEEKILSEKEVTGRAAWNRFFDETLGAARYDLNGKKVPQEQVLKQMYQPDRNARRAAAASLTAGLRENLRTLTFVFNTILADKASDDALRHYPTWISGRNLANKASDATVQALIDAVTSRYDLVARYYRLKRKLLGLDELYDHDRYAPLPIATDTAFKWDEARDIVLHAYERFHPRMAEIAGYFFQKNWIDAPVRLGKRGGAFSASVVPSVHPYILLNFVGTARDVSTLAHELGHGVHQYLSRPQGMLQAHTPLTTAEMASVFGEMLTFNDLLDHQPTPAARLALLAGKIEDAFATVFRQTSMNRFEDAIHTARRNEGELTSEHFSELWLNTQRAMFGDSVTMTEDYGIWWSYIPHFLHTPGYVYAYSFGELLVLALFARYRQEGDSFAPKYLDVLSAGGSDWPHTILSKLGVDLTDPGFWKLGLNEIEALVTQAEALADQVG
ncbi:MAG: M3 family oligoendopeptidase [Aggregatilineales bacterium]